MATEKPASPGVRNMGGRLRNEAGEKKKYSL